MIPSLPFNPDAPAPDDTSMLPGWAQMMNVPRPDMSVPDPSKPLSLQDWLALSYLTTALGGSVGQFFKKGVPPPPVGIPQGSPPPPSTPTAAQSSLGLAQTRKANRGGFGRG